VLLEQGADLTHVRILGVSGAKKPKIMAPVVAAGAETIVAAA
jgi:hypothetical protein